MPETAATQATPPRTTVVARDRTAAGGGPRRLPVPRSLSILRAGDVLAIFGAAAAALALTALLWTELAPFTGILGYVVVSWFLFVIFYAVLISFDENRPTVRDRVSAVVVQSLGLLVLAALGFVIAYTFWDGRNALFHGNFFTQDMHLNIPTDPLTKGGMVHAALGTLIEVGIAMVIAVPLGLLAAVYLAEVPGRFARFVRMIVEAMTALPDVLAGLFIYATLILIVFRRPSGFAAACALAVTAIPIICRAADVVLRLVPGGLTEASYALGSGQWRTVRFVTLPTARSGLATAVILGTARAIGETAPVLLTAGTTGYTNINPFNGPMMSLPLMAFTLTGSPEPDDIARGFAAGAVLLVLVIVLFLIARAAGGRGPGQLTPRQQRRRVVASRRDLARFERPARLGAVAPQGYSGGAQ
jgi:phosphate transport system permease protein